MPALVGAEGQAAASRRRATTSSWWWQRFPWRAQRISFNVPGATALVQELSTKSVLEFYYTVVQFAVLEYSR